MVSIASSILSASVILYGIHRIAGNRLLTWQFGVVNLYYFSEILLRCLMISVAFISVRKYAFIVAGSDIFLRGYIVSDGNRDKIDITLTYLYLGSNSAMNDEDGWVFHME